MGVVYSMLLMMPLAPVGTPGAKWSLHAGLQRSAKKKHRLTHYWLAHEGNFSGRRRVLLVTHSKRRRGKRRRRRRLRWVSRAFARALRMQGSGFLRGGRLVQYVKRCPGWKRRRKRRRLRCLRVRLVDRRRFPMGVGAAGMPLLPFRSVAVDSRIIALGSQLYIPALGRFFRRHGIRHDGCFWADDKGGGIKGRHIDLFVGSKRILRRSISTSMPRKVKLFINHPHCTSIPPRK